MSPRRLPRDGQWPCAVELRQLATLAALARAGTLDGAARLLEIAPATARKRIAQLERALGRQLVEARGRAVELTVPGRVLARHAEAVAGELRDAHDELRALVVGEGGAVRIGAAAGACGRLVARVVATLARRWPRFSAVAVQLADEERALATLVAGELDALLTDAPLTNDEDLEGTLLLRDEPVLLVASNSPLARAPRPLDAEQVAQAPLVVPRSLSAQRRLDGALRAAGVRPAEVHHADEPATVRALVAAGIATAILPRLAVDPHDTATTAVGLRHLLEPIPLTLAWRRGDSRLALDAVRDAAREGVYALIVESGALARAGRRRLGPRLPP